MVRVELRHMGIGACVAAILVALASCNGASTGISTSPSPSPTPTAAPTPQPSGPSPTPSPTRTPVPTPTPTVTGAVADIVFTGSYLLGPFEIDLYSNGVAIVTQSTGQSRQLVPLRITNAFFHELAQNLPVDKIPVGTCPKPTTAPTDETTITYAGETSGDISCPGNNPKTKRLYNAVVAVENALDLRAMLRARHPL